MCDMYFMRNGVFPLFCLKDLFEKLAICMQLLRIALQHYVLYIGLNVVFVTCCCSLYRTRFVFVHLPLLRPVRHVR